MTDNLHKSTQSAFAVMDQYHNTKFVPTDLFLKCIVEKEGVTYKLYILGHCAN